MRCHFECPVLQVRVQHGLLLRQRLRCGWKHWRAQVRSCDEVPDGCSDIVVSVSVSKHRPDNKSNRRAVVVAESRTLGIPYGITKHGAVIIVAYCVSDLLAVTLTLGGAHSVSDAAPLHEWGPWLPDSYGVSSARSGGRALFLHGQSRVHVPLSVPQRVGV